MELWSSFNPPFSILGYVYMVPGAGVNAGGKSEAPYWKTNVLGTPTQPPSTSPVVVDVVVRDTGTRAASVKFQLADFPPTLSNAPLIWKAASRREAMN